MDACTATSSMIVDLSGDNDNIGAITAANSLPKTSDDSPFERSCDNPECSAPKLISLVPKRETAEFITEPTVMNQPTLVNGFTTVFQVDGLAAKMNDIMNGNFNGATTSDGFGDQSKPKTVFRIVPNTHAHIVNYVVVDGAGDTLRKIKSNDPDTMHKLLDSQRLSAEQMLKKLISKALKTSTRKPESFMPLPIPSKVPGYTHLGVPSQHATSSAGDTGLLPPVPQGITITPLEPELPPISPLVIDITPKELPPKMVAAHTSKTVVATGKNTRNESATKYNKGNIKIASKESATKATVPNATSTTITPAVKSTSTITPTAPKLLTTHSTRSATSAITSTPRSKLDSSTTTGTSTSSTTATAHVPTSTSTTTTPVAPTPSPKTTQTLPTISPKAGLTRPNILKRKQTFVVTPDTMKRLRSRSPKQKAPMAVGLEPASTFPEPTRKLPMLPKLPTKPPAGVNSPAQPVHSSMRAAKSDVGTRSVVEKLPIAKAKECPASRSSAIAKAFASCLAEPEKEISLEDLPANTKPSTEPAPKMNAIKTLISTQALKPTVAAKVSAALAAKSGVARIGETLITATSKFSEDKSSVSQTKPCSVSMTKADASNLNTKINEFLQKEAALKATNSATPSKPAEASPSTTVLTDITKHTSTGPKVIAQTKTNLEPMKLGRRTSSPDIDPLAFDDIEKNSLITSNPAPLSSKPDTAPVTRSGRALMTKSTPEPDASSEKMQTLSTLPDAKASPKPHVPTTMKTRATAASNAAPTAKANNGSTTPSGTPIRSLRVVLPTLKSGIMTIPVRSPHPNLKIASVISGGSAVAAATHKTSPKPPAATEQNNSEIDKLQQELADLRRTVHRLSRKKT